MKLSKIAIEELGFDVIRAQLSDLCLSERAQREMAKIHPISQRDILKSNLQEVQEIRDLTAEGPIPDLPTFDVYDVLHILQKRGSCLDELSFSKLLRVISCGDDWRKKLMEQSDEHPALCVHASKAPKKSNAVSKITKIIDSNGQVKDNASPSLKKTREAIRSLQKKQTQVFQSAVSRYRHKGWLADASDTVVAGRRALSVKAEYKNKVAGSVLGSSGTMKHYFIEPEACVSLNDKLSQLELEEQNERYKILRDLTDELRPQATDFHQLQSFLTHIELLWVKHRFGQKIGGLLCTLSNETGVSLYRAYHPLLILNEGIDNVKPQDIFLHKKQRFLVISGPNAGGKSIALKTVGLLQIMQQCALPIPVDEKSSLGIFDNILADIGDQQSIDNQLSTYSFRLKNMKYFLKNAHASSLCLIDEFGTGSDPELGGSLAEVFFEELYDKKAFGVITTHYANIKLRANAMPEAENACMLFDTEKLIPKFILAIGHPGSSFTYEVAQKTGIPKMLIERAKGKLDESKVNLNATIGELHEVKSRYQEQSTSLNELQRKAKVTVDQYEKSKENLTTRIDLLEVQIEENNRKVQLGSKLEKWLSSYLEGAPQKQLIQSFVRFLKMEHTKKETLEKEAKREAREVKKKQFKKKQKKEREIPIKVNSRVRLKHSKQVGVVQSMDGDQVEILVGNFVVKASLDQVRGIF